MENEQRIRLQEIDAAATVAASQNSKNSSPQNSLQHQNQARKNSTNNEMIKELKKRNPANGGAGDRRSRPQTKKEINIEDLIEGMYFFTIRYIQWFNLKYKFGNFT